MPAREALPAEADAGPARGGASDHAAANQDSASRAPLPSVRRVEIVATRLLFLIVGIGTATWAPLVPFVKARAGLDESGLGLLLLCLGVGSIAAMPSAGAMAARLGFRPVLAAATVALCIALPVLATATEVRTLAAALLLFGAGIGALDCVMNLQAVAVERRAGRPMMSGFHGLYSLGCILGALAFSGSLSVGASAPAATAAAVVAIAAMFLASWSGILAGGGGSSGPAFALPRGPVLLLGALCFVVFLTEGSALDWSAVFLIQDRGVDPASAALGYAAFSVAMTAGRLGGDPIVARLGPRRIVVLGGLLAASGLAVTVLAPAWEATLLGYALVGAGCANIVPVLFTAAGRQTAVPESVAVPAITTLGYAGVLAGPAAIGFVAQGLGLPAAFLIVAALLVGVAGSARFLRV